MNRFFRLASAVLALCASATAQASLYELSWAWKWGEGRIVYDGDTADSNPHPLQGSFLGAIESFDVTGWQFFDQTHVSGSGGSISVAATNTPRGNPSCSFCGTTVLTFQFGSQDLPDPSAWQLSLIVPGSLYGGGDGLPPAFLSDGLFGNLYLPSEGTVRGTISEGIFVTNQILRPVPEPETWLLLGLGLAGVVAARRRFSASSSPAGDGPTAPAQSR